MVKVSILLEKLANQLDDPDSEIIMASENDEHMLNIVSYALVHAAGILRKAAKDVLKIEPAIDADSLQELSLVAADLDLDEELSKYADGIDTALDLFSKSSEKDSESIENVGKLAEIFDKSENESLNKLASVLDEILLTIGAPKDSVQKIKSAEDSEIEKIRNKHRKPSSDFFSLGNEKKQEMEDAAVKAINEKVKEYKPMEHALNTRYCPDHAGVSLMRIGDGVWQCELDKKIYDFNSGYTTLDGDKVPGTSVSNQTQNLRDHAPEHINFSNREQKLNG